MKKFQKTRKILQLTGITIIVPLENLKNAGQCIKDAFLDSFSKASLYFKNANILRKDLYSANLQIAKYHLDNNNMFDAKLRYKMAHFFNKTKTEPLLLLAEIFITEKKPKKAIPYLKKALKITTKPEERQAVMEIIQSL